jgi:hypothetical protein
LEKEGQVGTFFTWSIKKLQVHIFCQNHDLGISGYDILGHRHRKVLTLSRLKNVQPISQPLVQHGAAPETPRPTKALRQRSRPGAGAQGRDFHHIHQILIIMTPRGGKKRRKKNMEK